MFLNAIVLIINAPIYVDNYPDKIPKLNPYFLSESILLNL